MKNLRPILVFGGTAVGLIGSVAAYASVSGTSAVSHASFTRSVKPGSVKPGVVSCAPGKNLENGVCVIDLRRPATRSGGSASDHGVGSNGTGGSSGSGSTSGGGSGDGGGGATGTSGGGGGSEAREYANDSAQRVRHPAQQASEASEHTSQNPAHRVDDAAEVAEVTKEQTSSDVG